jgi:mRNA interferase RelE/StbE
MSFKIRLHPDAVKFLVDLNSETKERLKSGIKNLETDPFKASRLF